MASFSCWAAAEKLLLLTKCFHHPLTQVGEKILWKWQLTLMPPKAGIRGASPPPSDFFVSSRVERICTLLFISLVHPQNLVFIQRHNHPFFSFSGLAKARKLIANIVLTCLWEKLEKKSLFLALASRGSGFERNEMGRGGMSLLPHNCPLFLQHLSGRLQSCQKVERTIKERQKQLAEKQLEFSPFLGYWYMYSCHHHVALFTVYCSY